MSASSQRLPYAPALDGLRAVACLSVMLYHVGLMRGGFLGVNVFFTLSGFLITSLLLAELRADGSVDLRAFWRRRVFRIVPLLATVSLTLGLWAAAHGGSVGQATIAAGVASLLFSVNWLVTHGAEAGGALTANWSVAVEEQFYLAWPVLLAVLYRFRRTERTIAIVVAAAGVALAVHRFLVVPDWSASRVWFGSDMQADGLLAGCAVALGLRCRSRMTASVAAIGLASLLLFAGENTFTYQLGLPLTTLCTALVLPVLADHRGWLAGRLLRAVGRRSYGLYLWGSAINFLALDVYGLHGPELMVAVFPATFLVTEVTYRVVEVPFRRLGNIRRGGPHRLSISDSAGGGELEQPPAALQQG